MAKHNEVGVIGEKIAEDFLKRKGHKIVTKNFRKPYGEIDIVSREKSGKWHFVEVKTVSRETLNLEVSHETGSRSVSHETYRPEENVHPQKVKRLMRVIESYILSQNIEDEWQFDVIAVYLDQKNKTAKVQYLEDLVLGFS